MNEDYNDQLEKERGREMLSKNEYGSVFGHPKTDTVSSSESSGRSSYHASSVSTHGSKIDAEAAHAAKLEQTKAMKEIQARQAHPDSASIPNPAKQLPK